MSHIAKNTTSGNLYKTSTELLIIEIGLGNDFSTKDYQQFSDLCTNLLVKSSWKFLYETGIQMKHVIILKPPRENDYPLMKMFYEKGAD
jgi:hypothetical protein